MVVTKVIHIKDAPRGWEANDQFVYIGRAGHNLSGYWGNPFRLNAGEPRGATIERFRKYAETRRATDEGYAAALTWLHGKTLVCFCKPNPCHGDVLAEMADR